MAEPKSAAASAPGMTAAPGATGSGNGALAGKGDAGAAKAAGEGGKAKKKRTAKLDDFVLGVHRMATVLADAGIFAKHGVTIGEWATLKAMGDKPQVSLRSVTKGTSLSRQRMRTLLTDLEKKGFIKVERSGSAGSGSGVSSGGDADKRTRALTILPKRNEVVNAISAELEAVTAQSPSLKTANKRLTAGVRLSEKLANHLRKSAADGKKAKKKDKKEGAGAAARGPKPGKQGKQAKQANPARAEARAKKKAAKAAKAAKAMEAKPAA